MSILRIKQITFLLFLTLLLSGCFAGPKKARILERADRYFKAGDYDKAKVEYLNVLRVDGQNVTAFQQLGLIWLEQGVPLRAVPFLVRARDLSPQNVAIRAKLALAFMGAGDVADARKEALSVLQQDPANSDAMVLLAESSRTKEEFAGTEQQLQKFPNKNTAAFHIAAASFAVNKGDIGVATDELQQALAVDPKSAPAHLATGYLYLLRKDPAHAGPELKAAADLAPLRSGERIKYAEFKAGNGAADEAKAVLQSITKDAPDYLPAWRDLAQIAVEEKKYDEALSLLENVLSRNPVDPDARLLQAQIWLAKGDTAKATFNLDGINNDYPNNPLIKYNLARAYIASNHPAQAAAALEQAIAIKSDYADAIIVLAELNLRSGKAQSVALAMEDLCRKRPDLPQARSLLANAYKALGRLDDAAAVFRQQIKSTPESADAYMFLGLILRQQGKNDEARQAFEKVSEMAPDNLNSIDQLVEMDLADKRYDAAEQRVKAQLQKHPNTAGIHFLEAKIHVARATPQDWANAEAELKKAIELNPNFTLTYELLVSVYVSENKLAEAIGQLEAEQKTNSDDPRPLLMEGVIYERLKDYPKARDAYEKVLAVSPDSLLALNNLAYLYSEQLNQLDRAYELAQKARTLQPNNESVADTLGWILYRRGDYQQALALIQESASKSPQNPVVQFHLGMTSAVMGQADAARSALEQAAHSTVDFPDKDEAKRQLARVAGSSSGGTKDLATGELESRLKQQPNDLITLQRLAEAYEKRGESAKAAAAYEQIFKLNPKLSSAALELAQLYAGPLQDRNKAVEFAKKARELAPNDAQTSAVAGHIALEAGNYIWAHSLLQESARQRLNNAGVLYDLAMSAYALGRVSDARQTMEACLKAEPDTVQSQEAKKFLSMTTLDQSPADAVAVAAEGEVQNSLNGEPEYVPGLMVKAAIEMRRNDKKSAAEIYSRVLRKYPDFAPAQKQLAAIYQDNPDELGNAYDLAMKARKTLPDDPQLARTLAEINFKRKEFSYAVQLFEESARKNPLPPEDLYYLGMAQLQSRQEAKGRETLKGALAAGLEDPLAQKAKSSLAEKQPK